MAQKKDSEKKVPKQEKEKKTFVRWGLKIGIIILVLSGFIAGCSYINQKLGVRDDHILEEIAEDYILKETGIDIDLSIDSPE